MGTSATELNLKVHTVENVDSRGQDPTGKQVVSGASSSEMIQAVFATREGSESQLLETPKGEYFVVRTDRVTPARTPALSEVEAKIVDAWQAEERRKRADAKVKEALDKANAGGDLGAIAKELGLELRTTKPVTRYDADPGNYLTQAATQELFKLAVGKAASVRSAEGSTIVRPKEIQAADLAKEKDLVERFGKQLDGMVGNDLIAQLLAALRAKYGVSVNDQLFMTAFQPQSQQ